MRATTGLPRILVSARGGAGNWSAGRLVLESQDDAPGGWVDQEFTAGFAHAPLRLLLVTH